MHDLHDSTILYRPDEEEIPEEKEVRGKMEAAKRKRSEDKKSNSGCKMLRISGTGSPFLVKYWQIVKNIYPSNTLEQEKCRATE